MRYFKNYKTGQRFASDNYYRYRRELKTEWFEGGAYYEENPCDEIPMDDKPKPKESHFDNELFEVTSDE